MSWHNAKFKVGEYVGLEWQPTNRIEFFIEDVSIINQMVSGISWFEYRISRKDYKDANDNHSIGWYHEDKIFKVDQPSEFI